MNHSSTTIKGTINLREAVLPYTLPEIPAGLYIRDAEEPGMCGEEAARYITQFVDLGCHSTKIITTSTVSNLIAIKGKTVRSIVNLKQMNDIRNINELLAAVNRRLPQDGLYIGCVETLEERKERIFDKFSKVISYPYYFFDFMLRRVFPKLWVTRGIYNVLTRSQDRPISITEILGRLRVCGFKIEDYGKAEGLTYFVVRKIAEPLVETERKYGMIIPLRRIGKGGKWFNVYKLRTMHPYAEFLQEYLYTKYSLTNGDKITDDFRVTSWGRYFRKVWLDEQPMWFNWLRGDVKLIGVRPLSHQKFNLYPPEFRKRRINYKPGLIPPFYVDLPESIDELVESEKKYLDAYDKNPWLTDLRYLLTALYNIFIKQVRSE